MERFWDFLNKIAILCGIIPIFVTAVATQPWLPRIYAFYVCGLNCSLVCYVAYVHRRKHYRYAQVVPFIHNLNHAIRDRVVALQKKAAAGKLSSEDCDELSSERIKTLLDCVSIAFTRLCGVQCSVCIKQLQPNRELLVIARDSQSAVGRPIGIPAHSIDDDTPCQKLYSPDEPTSYYLCNDVVGLWKRDPQLFRSPSFKTYGAKPPDVVEICGIRWAKHWPLRFKSCMVFPIRYTPLPDRSGSTPPHKVPGDYWGFLCIDSEHKDVFDKASWTVGAACADALYLYSSSTYAILDAETKPQLIGQSPS
jgi:hypothetical protein